MNKLIYKHITSVMTMMFFCLTGVLVEGKSNYPRVIDNVNYIIQANKKVFFLTNAPCTISSLLSRLTTWGIQATEEMIIS